MSGFFISIMEVVILPKYDDLTGKIFNRLTVIKKGENKNKKIYWICKCECGNECEVRADSLKSGRTKSCGCLNTETRSNLGKSHIQDISNQKFGKLIAIKRTETRVNSTLGYNWVCECECGNIIEVPITYLKSGNTISCGCLKKSFGEQKIASKLIENHVKFETQKTFPQLIGDAGRNLAFDFYLTELNVLIEFDGPQHYKKTNYTTDKTIKYDKQKNEMCLSQNIPLFRIPYSDLSLIDNYTIEDILSTKYRVDKIDYYF